MKFASGGTGNEGTVLTARLVRDNDSDGQVSTGDVDLTNGTISGDNGTVEFTGLSLQVPANDSATVLVVFDFGAGTTPGTYGLTLEVGQDIEATGGASSMGITATGAPVAGPTLTLSQGSAGSGTGAVFFMGSCGGPVDPSPAGWAGLLLLISVGIGAIILKRRAYEGSR
ncbi:MAG: hypothetical protein ACYTFG_21275, partial [Planctomycetota bacterium]|jgi:hypothetical protein